MARTKEVIDHFRVSPRDEYILGIEIITLLAAENWCSSDFLGQCEVWNLYSARAYFSSSPTCEHKVGSSS